MAAFFALPENGGRRLSERFHPGSSRNPAGPSRELEYLMQDAPSFLRRLSAAIPVWILTTGMVWGQGPTPPPPQSPQPVNPTPVKGALVQLENGIRTFLRIEFLSPRRPPSIPRQRIGRCRSLTRRSWVIVPPPRRDLDRSGRPYRKANVLTASGWSRGTPGKYTYSGAGGAVTAELDERTFLLKATGAEALPTSIQPIKSGRSSRSVEPSITRSSEARSRPMSPGISGPTEAESRRFGNRSPPRNRSRTSPPASLWRMRPRLRISSPPSSSRMVVPGTRPASRSPCPIPVTVSNTSSPKSIPPSTAPMSVDSW